MKRSNSFSIKRLIARAYFISSVILFCNLSSFAQQPSHQINFKNGSIAYQGVEGDELIFKVNIENNLQRKISLVILDNSGEKIFTRLFSEKTISKKFRIPAGTGPVTFVISDRAGKKDQQFKIIADQRYVSEFSIKRVI